MPILHVHLDFPERWGCVWLLLMAVKVKLGATDHDGTPEWHLRTIVPRTLKKITSVAGMAKQPFAFLDATRA